MRELLLGSGWWPELDPEVQSFLRAGYGVLLAATLVLALPHRRRYFLSERFGGYVRASRVDDLLRPRALPVVLAVWLGCAVLIATGTWAVWAALVNLLLCHWFFIRMRWRSVLRGMGAPGFMTFWLGGTVFLLELASAYAPGQRELALLVVQVDLALIFLSAGIYKLLAGYRRNYGVDIGLANPEWGYWWRRWRTVRPDHVALRGLNQLGWLTEIVAAILMLLPPTRFLGAALIAATFVLIRTQIRLGLLCEAVILACVLYFHPGSVGDEAVRALFGWLPASSAPGGVQEWLATPLAVALCAYLALLPLAHAGLAVNLYRRRTLPGPLQRALDLFTNAFGVIVWRVFSVDVVNFFIRIHRQPHGDPGRRALVSDWGWRHGLRYAQVGEAIAVTSLFTTLKYFPSNSGLFVERLLRYARTVPRPPGSELVFEYVSVVKGARRFEHVPVAEFVVDPEAATVEERSLDETARIRGGHPLSPVHEALRPGTYAPAAR